MPKILLVDDEPSIRLTMAEFLRRAGYEVAAAADFAEACARSSEGAVDAAVVDINLAGRSGIELLEELSGREPYVPVVMITGEPSITLLPEIVRAGAYDFIAKPVVKDVLLKAVARAVERKRLTDEKRALEEEVRRHAAELERRVDERTRQLVEAHDALARQEKVAALGRVAAQIAHEVKNPLAGLLLYAMHLKTRSVDKLSEQEVSLLDKIIDTVNHLTGTCEQVLDFARHVSRARRPADLNRVASDVLQLAAPQLEAARVETRLALADSGAVAHVDESSVRAALMNLVLNAAQAMRGGGLLSVSTRRAGGAVGLEIADTGAGMTAEQAEKIFEPFYTTKAAGLGLGMPYAKKVVEQHGGAIEVESREGVGTTVRLTLPADGGGVNESGEQPHPRR